MKIINFRSDICFAIIVCVCVLLTIFFLILHGNQSQRINVATKKHASVRHKHISLKSGNRTHIQRLLLRPRNGQSIKKTSWQNILNNKPLRLGWTYSRRRRSVFCVLGVPTVHRAGENYLLDTLYLLIENMNAYHRDNSLIVVYIGETNASIVHQIWQDINETFGDALDVGLIDVITPPAEYYPEFDKLYQTLHDEPSRVRWRTKQTLDYMYLMTYARSRGVYYLQLEDDIVPTDGYMEYINKLSALHTNFRLAHHRRWIVMSFCDLGFIGKLFRTEELQRFQSYVQLFYNDQPIDWLLQSYVKLKCCRWDGFEMPDCHREYSQYFIRADQSQFQHNGLKSSLLDKEQQLQDKRFDKDSGRLRMQHLRQPFNLIASHKRTMLREKLELKEGETFLWGYMPHDFSIARYLRQHQFDARQFKIRNNDNFAELFVNVTNEVPTFTKNSSKSKQCGFIMSLTAGGRFEPPTLMYFYMKDNDTTGGELSWFRRFFWSK
ncbi:alpha-1,3-mannosyl-glycoprotein 4-beta-N-acetylglucosaminyltransferase A [Drosophila albomicans]|uniref:Alpha-1,3-mannosyl-glycoprotein 4-beta-N-acetylglucosaminyltransferase A n=1 Tax=Drosophila albomicans TaxID=7291 RepID=A0A6P8WUE8_DROAB|nr:alpha-1,3-mannosyl-glycoprotein 4-beta-N-acetylglucosaminyltransferase A [Drosophila albomicans]